MLPRGNIALVVDLITTIPELKQSSLKLPIRDLYRFAGGGDPTQPTFTSVYAGDSDETYSPELLASLFDISRFYDESRMGAPEHAQDLIEDVDWARYQYGLTRLYLVTANPWYSHHIERLTNHDFNIEVVVMTTRGKHMEPLRAAASRLVELKKASPYETFTIPSLKY